MVKKYTKTIPEVIQNKKLAEVGLARVSRPTAVLPTSQANSGIPAMPV